MGIIIMLCKFNQASKVGAIDLFERKLVRNFYSLTFKKLIKLKAAAV